MTSPESINLTCPCGATLEYRGAPAYAAKRAEEFYAAHSGHERPATAPDSIDDGVPEGATVVTGSHRPAPPVGFYLRRGRRVEGF